MNGIVLFFIDHCWLIRTLSNTSVLETSFVNDVPLCFIDTFDG